MNDLECYIKFKNFIEYVYHDIILPSHCIDVYELIYFIKEFLRPDYLVNFREIIKLYDVRFSDDDYKQQSKIILKFIHKLKNNI